MKAKPCPRLEAMRARHPALPDSPAGEMFGFFVVAVNGQERMHIISSGHEAWEHVSVSVVSAKKYRTPRWQEMCAVKDLFWDLDEVVLQFHPAKKDYVNAHPNCLHLWKQAGIDHETPPKVFLA